MFNLKGGTVPERLFNYEPKMVKSKNGYFYPEIFYPKKKKNFTEHMMKIHKEKGKTDCLLDNFIDSMNKMLEHYLEIPDKFEAFKIKGKSKEYNHIIIV